MKTLCNFALMAAFAAIPCLGQTGTVIFYSRGITAKTAAARAAG
jgi:hypothetical protein